jgi:hypothetical protein
MFSRQFKVEYQMPNKSHGKLLSLIFLAATPLVLSQNPDRSEHSVKVTALNLHAPIQVIAVVEGSQSFPLPRGMNQVVSLHDTNQNWLNSLSFTVQNNSPKIIVTIEARISVDSWEVDPLRPHKFVWYHEGQLPEHARHDGNNAPILEDSSMKLAVTPGSTVDVPLGQAITKLQKSFLSEQVPLSATSGISIQIDRVFFADGTLWAHNQFLKPDLTAPAKYLPITPDEWGSQN